MGRKSTAKAVNQSASQPPPPGAPGARSRMPAEAIAVVAVLIAAGGFAYMRSGRDVGVQAVDAQASASQPAPVPAANQKAHPQAKLPPLEYPEYPMQRSKEVVTAAYRFAAEHPEILSYVPCYCGCEHMGH